MISIAYSEFRQRRSIIRRGRVCVIPSASARSPPRRGGAPLVGRGRRGRRRHRSAALFWRAARRRGNEFFSHSSRSRESTCTHVAARVAAGRFYVDAYAAGVRCSVRKLRGRE
ncbi:hypothetical protein EVAR_36374_1 [Eumeta japonica]|uniref:Uncharacterized protein n=1 Tax=Eumeta variegata TaxID=151549 RepID=A0A4C1W5U8_EUMVA|nr:hypothetical protein EVAR_36374_1 [Eumeta japonica]